MLKRVLFAHSVSTIETIHQIDSLLWLWYQLHGWTIWMHNIQVQDVEDNWTMWRVTEEGGRTWKVGCLWEWAQGGRKGTKGGRGLYNFASVTVTQGFCLQNISNIPVESGSKKCRKTQVEGVVHKPFNSSSSKVSRLWFLACSPWNYWDSSKALLHLLLATFLSCKRLRYLKSLYNSRDAQWS